VFLPDLHFYRDYSHFKQENVAIANALQLEAARVTPDLSRFIYDAVPSLLKSLSLSMAVL